MGEYMGLIGPAVMLLLAAVGWLGTHFTYKTKVEDLGEKLDAQGKNLAVSGARIDAAHDKVSQLELRIEREFVKKGDLSQVEQRIGLRIDQVTHDLKGATAQIIAALTIVRAPSRGRGGGE